MTQFLKLVQTVSEQIVAKKLLKPNQLLLVTVSGGQDSVCLFLILLHLKNQWNWKIHTVYCNHLWQKESLFIAKQLGKFTNLFQIPLYLTVTPNNILSEKKARDWRYAIFYRLGIFLMPSPAFQALHRQFDLANKIELLNVSKILCFHGPSGQRSYPVVGWSYGPTRAMPCITLRSLLLLITPLGFFGPFGPFGLHGPRGPSDHDQDHDHTTPRQEKKTVTNWLGNTLSISIKSVQWFLKKTKTICYSSSLSKTVDKFSKFRFVIIKSEKLNYKFHNKKIIKLNCFFLKNKKKFFFFLIVFLKNKEDKEEDEYVFRLKTKEKQKRQMKNFCWPFVGKSQLKPTSTLTPSFATLFFRATKGVATRERAKHHPTKKLKKQNNFNRYCFFKKQIRRPLQTAVTTQISLITGHSSTDKIETLLFNLIRGCGLKGIYSLKWKRSIKSEKYKNIFLNEFLIFQNNFFFIINSKAKIDFFPAIFL